jgi:transaldolase
MKLFIDSADLTEIRTAIELGVISGVTTNPSLLAKNGSKAVKAVIQDIAAMVPATGSVSMECVSDTADGMLAEGRDFATWAPNVYVKVPFGVEGIKAVKQFTAEGIRTNVTLVFSTNQALLAANAGASFISSFVGRLDDIGFDGLDCIREAVDLVGIHGFNSEILAASIRHPMHITQAALAGAHIATLPFNVLKQLYQHPLTEKGIQQFTADWQTLQAVTV